MKYCLKCGNELLDEAAFCPKCGCPVEEQAQTTPSKKKGRGKLRKIVVALLVILGLLIGFYFVGTLMDTTEPEPMSDVETSAYDCAIRLVERIMDRAKNPHSMEIYTLKYYFEEKEGSSYDGTMYIYIEYALANDVGGMIEDSGFGDYFANLSERKYAYGLGLSEAQLAGEATYEESKRNPTNWSTLDIGIVKENTGLG